MMETKVDQSFARWQFALNSANLKKSDIGQSLVLKPHFLDDRSKKFLQINISSIYHRHIEHFFTFLAGNTVFSLVSESPC